MPERKPVMDNKIEIFKNEQFGEVRTILEGEKVLFCAADVAKALGYTNPNKAVNDHCRAITKRSTPISGGCRTPAKIFNKVDLPAPFFPIKAIRSFSFI